MILVIILFCGSISLTLVEIAAIKKRLKINTAISFAVGKEKAKSKTSTYLESTSLGIGASALNIYDIYEACDNHEEVLEVLGYRYNRLMGDAEPLDWFNKVEELSIDNATGSYVSGYAGQAAENASLDYFESLGKKAELFTSRIHPNDDIRVFNEYSSVIDYSVKSYDDVSNFNAEVSQHPESINYVVNSELYEKLKETGELAEYSDNGIEILDGEFSNDIARETAQNTIGDISDAGDLSDNIPIIALALFGVKTVRNIYFMSHT